jgi:predicted RNA-binding protein with PUA-like domain
MPNYWLLKTEPGEYSIDQLQKDKTSVWDGVSNNLALMHLRSVRRGDRVFIYHSGDERKIVGIAKITSNPHADTKLKDAKRVVVDVEFEEKLASPVALDAIKGVPEFEGFELLRLPRLSVMPVSAERWNKIVEMSK